MNPDERVKLREFILTLLRDREDNVPLADNAVSVLERLAGFDFCSRPC